MEILERLCRIHPTLAQFFFDQRQVSTDECEVEHKPSNIPEVPRLPIARVRLRHNQQQPTSRVAAASEIHEAVLTISALLVFRSPGVVHMRRTSTIVLAMFFAVSFAAAQSIARLSSVPKKHPTLVSDNAAEQMGFKVKFSSSSQLSPTARNAATNSAATS